MEKELRSLLTCCKLCQHLEKVKVIFLYIQEKEPFLWQKEDFPEESSVLLVCSPITDASSCAQARDYALYLTAMTLQELVMQIMHRFLQTNCHTQLFLSRADKARWKERYMSHTLNQQHNLEQKLSLQGPDSSWLLLLEGPVSVSIHIKTLYAC